MAEIVPMSVLASTKEENFFLFRHLQVRIKKHENIEISNKI